MGLLGTLSRYAAPLVALVAIGCRLLRRLLATLPGPALTTPAVLLPSLLVHTLLGCQPLHQAEQVVS